AGLTCHSLYASPVLSPNAAAVHTDGVFFCDDCSCWSLRAGFRGDYVFDRKLSSYSADHQGTTVASMMSNEGVVTLNFWDRLDIYGLVGATTTQLSSIAFNSSGSTVLLESSTPSSTIWGVGARATILEYNFGCCGTSYLGADINYESGSTGSGPTTFSGMPVDIPITGRYKETQISLQIGHRIAMLTPYIAAKWSNANATAYADTSAYPGSPIPSHQDNFRNTGNHWGYAVGVLLIDAGRMSVTAEARFIDEKAMTIMGEFRF
ncbi:MAG: hypothetical protein NTY13_03780, partial [Chlamydiae bacterium]|nr:hypothetical protein [Chlamydiota bacterium]